MIRCPDWLPVPLRACLFISIRRCTASKNYSKTQHASQVDYVQLTTFELVTRITVTRLSALGDSQRRCAPFLLGGLLRAAQFLPPPTRPFTVAFGPARLPRQVDRESRILSEAYPYIASRLLTDSAPELQDALQQLLFKDGKPRFARAQLPILRYIVSSLSSSLGCILYKGSVQTEITMFRK